MPSETDNLVALGAGARLLGATRYCEPPPDAPPLPRVGGTKDADPDAIAALEPDLVLANQEENARALTRQMAERNIPLFVSFPRTVGEGIALPGAAGAHPRLARRRAGQEHRRGRPIAALRAAEETLARDAREGRRPLNCFLPIWMEPLMTISGETLVSDALRLAGARNVFSERRRRYPLAAHLGRAEALSDEQVGARDTRYPRVTSTSCARAIPSWSAPHEATPLRRKRRDMVCITNHSRRALRRSSPAAAAT